MNWHLKNVKRGKQEKLLKNKEKRRNMRRKRQSWRKLKGKRGRKNAKLRKNWRGRKRKGVRTHVMIDWVEIEEGLGELEVEEKMMMGQEAEHGEVVVVAVAGGIEKRGRKMSGDQEVEIEEREGMMMEGVARHPRGEALRLEEGLHQEVMEELGEGEMPPQEDLHQGVEEVEMMVLQEEAHHQEEISGIEMVEVLGDQAPGTILHVTAVVQEEGGGILATGEGPLQGEWVTGLHPEEGHHLGETLGETMIGEVLLLDVHLQTVMEGECGAVVVTGLPPGEDLLLGADLPQEEAPLQGVALHPAEDPVTMDLLTGAVTDLLHVTTLPLPNLADQPVITKTKAGQLSSVSPEYSWDYPGSRDICQITRSCHASRILLAPVT